MKQPITKCDSSISSLLSVAQVELQLKKMPEVKTDALAIVAVIVGLVRTPKRSLLHGGVWLWQLEEFEGFGTMSAKPSPTIVVLSEQGDKNPITMISTVRPK